MKKEANLNKKLLFFLNASKLLKWHFLRHNFFFIIIIVKTLTFLMVLKPKIKKGYGLEKGKEVYVAI